MPDADVDPLILLFSPDRLDPLIRLTQCPKAAIGLHQEILALGALLMSVIAAVEIALRNAAYANLTKHFRCEDWLVEPPQPFVWQQNEIKLCIDARGRARRVAYEKLSPLQKADLTAAVFPQGFPEKTMEYKRAEMCQAYMRVSDSRIIAETTFHFWKRLYGRSYEHSLWKTSLKRTFPSKFVKRSEVAFNLELIHKARNRLAHHEPVVNERFNDTVKAVQFIVRHLETSATDFVSPLAKLLSEPIRQAEEQAVALHRKMAAYRTDNAIRL